MILLIDIGNTNTVLGLSRNGRIVHSWRIETAKNRTEDEYEVILRGLFSLAVEEAKEINNAVVSCVVPNLNEVYRKVCIRITGKEPLFVGPGIRTGMPILLDNPREVGADRIVNAVGAYVGYGGPVVVLDFGTAVTFDVVSENGEYLGGVICPGPSMGASSLASKASQLYKVEVTKAEKAIAKSTAECIKAGIYFGFLGQIEMIVGRIEKELGSKPVVVATGGMAEVFEQESEVIDVVDRELTLMGLQIIFDRNR